MSIVTWRSDVNTRILDSTTFEIGGTGIKKQSLDNGYEEQSASSLVHCSTYNVTMEFDWLEKDANGLSEYDRFKNWFTYTHQLGANPFWFESIERFTVNGGAVDEFDNPVMCLYKIKDKYSTQKSGFCFRITMTWQEVYKGLIQVPDQPKVIDHINAENGYIYVQYTETPELVPSITDYAFKYCLLTDQIDGTNLEDYTAFNNVYRMDQIDNLFRFSVNKLPQGNYKIIVDDDLSLNCILRVV